MVLVRLRTISPLLGITVLFFTVLAANSCDCAAAARQQISGQSPMRRIGVEMHQSSKIPQIFAVFARVFQVQTISKPSWRHRERQNTLQHSPEGNPEVSEITFCIAACMYSLVCLEAKKKWHPISSSQHFLRPLLLILFTYMYFLC